jgi:hypothetical protein
VRDPPHIFILTSKANIHWSGWSNWSNEVQFCPISISLVQSALSNLLPLWGGGLLDIGDGGKWKQLDRVGRQLAGKVYLDDREDRQLSLNVRKQTDVACRIMATSSHADHCPGGSSRRVFLLFQGHSRNRVDSLIR